MGMYIQINDTDDLSDRDLQVLRTLAGVAEGQNERAVAAAKIAEKVAAPPKAKAEPVKAAEPEPTESDVSMEDVVARATALISAGKSAVVREALAKFGAKKVSELDDANCAEFLSELDAA